MASEYALDEDAATPAALAPAAGVSEATQNCAAG
jgi:hypothetical protein